jgi:ABC-type amino acid transport substrate-binding protein
VYYSLENGEADMAFSFAKTEERLKKYVYSRQPLYSHYSDSIFFLKSKFPNGIHFGEYKDLVGYTMLGDDPSWYAEDFKKLGVDTIWLLTGANKWRMLLLGRADALLSDTYQGLYELREKEQASDAFKGRIGFKERTYPAEIKSIDYIIFSKPHFDNRTQLIRDSMDQALEKLDLQAAVTKVLDEQYSSDPHQVQ